MLWYKNKDAKSAVSNLNMQSIPRMPYGISGVERVLIVYYSILLYRPSGRSYDNYVKIIVGRQIVSLTTFPKYHSSVDSGSRVLKVI